MTYDLDRTAYGNRTPQRFAKKATKIAQAHRSSLQFFNVAVLDVQHPIIVFVTQSPGEPMSTAPLYDIPVHKITGEGSSLSEYRGKVLLIVNVASKCGLTPQYDALEKLYTRFKDSGLAVLGFPANDFAGQEPGSNEDIQTFCRSTFGVNFPMFSKIAVTGPETHPLYASLIAARPKATGPGREAFRENLDGYLKQHNATTNPEPGVLWNFEKFLVDRNGNVVNRFSPDVVPDDPSVVAAIESALKS
jgi:glutathione peroxidase